MKKNYGINYLKEDIKITCYKPYKRMMTFMNDIYYKYENTFHEIFYECFYGWIMKKEVVKKEVKKEVVKKVVKKVFIVDKMMGCGGVYFGNSFRN